jgi:predicted aldo/keto reductase-like oxidoreductase
MRRRIFAGGVFSGLGLTGLFARPAAARPGDIPTRPFGRTDVRLTVVGQGGARLALLRTREDAVAHVRYALSLGVNYFDCAASYWEGHSEETYGVALPEVRKSVFITTKTGRRTRIEAEADLAASLRRLRTDYLDLWQIHGVQEHRDVERIFAPGGAIEAFEAARKAGRARFIGFTGHHDPAVHLEMLKAYDRWDSILMPVHAADPAYLSFEKSVLPAAVERGLAIQAMKVFGNAFLLRVLNARECLRYALSLPVHCATVGCSTAGQWDDDVRIARDFKPYTPDEMAALRHRAVTAGPGGARGPQLEYWKRPGA